MIFHSKHSIANTSKNRIKSADMFVKCSVVKYQWLDNGRLLAHYNHCLSVLKTMINDLNVTIRKLVWMQLSGRVNSAICLVWVRVIHFCMSQLVRFLAISPSWLLTRDPVEKTVEVLNEYENIVWGLYFCMGLSVYCECMHLICCRIEHQSLTPLTALWPSLRSDQAHSVLFSHSHSLSIV